MKKFLIIAAAAIVAAAACTKSETRTPDFEVRFQVANYTPATRAEAFDINSTFSTSAWFHENETAAAQEFMDSEVISWQSASRSWAPSRVYFWPKTGWVNFFSQAGTPAATITEGQAAYSAKTIAITDDALLASAAYRYNANKNVYDIQYESTDVQGVPTLFHHILSKVTVQVRFDASELTGKADADKYKWNLVIDEASLIYANKGSLTVNFTDPAATGQAWPYSAATVGWVPTSGEANVTEAAPAANIGSTKTITTVAPNVSDPNILLDQISVMPQDVSAAPAGTDAKFAVKFTITEFYDNVEGIHYTVDLTGTDAIPVSDFTNGVNAWNMNYKYTYTLTVKPNKTVTFDPAVAEWESVTDPEYIYPNA